MGRKLNSSLGAGLPALAVAGGLLANVALAGAASAATRCEDLKALALPDVTITSAADVAAGVFAEAGGKRQLPAHCRVVGVLRPTADSEIKFETWLPADWNGRFFAVGNGGMAGSIIYEGGLIQAVQRGYVGASTYTGHSETDFSWLAKPEKIKDFGWRAHHLTAVAGKALAAAFYGRKPDYSYFYGCSGGGRQALVEAQRFPEDYDGIIAGSPSYNSSKVMAGYAWNLAALKAAPIRPDQTPLLAAAVLKQCDALDGVTDGVVSHPPLCRFDPSVLQCKAGQADDCFTAGQVDALRKLYGGARDAKGGKVLAGWSPGGEVGAFPGWGWEGWFFGTSPISHAGFLAAYTMGGDVELGGVDPDMDAQPDLARFAARGGKLILFHGWSDAATPPLNTVDYYDEARASLGEKRADETVRLFMVPGLQHCYAGPGMNSFGGFTPPAPPADPNNDLGAALELWVEKGVAPKSLTAAHVQNFMGAIAGPSEAGAPQRTGLLCPYPKWARWDGKGDPKSAASYACK